VAEPTEPDTVLPRSEVPETAETPEVAPLSQLVAPLTLPVAPLSQLVAPLTLPVAPLSPLVAPLTLPVAPLTVPLFVMLTVPVLWPAVTLIVPCPGVDEDPELPLAETAAPAADARKAPTIPGTPTAGPADSSVLAVYVACGAASAMAVPAVRTLDARMAAEAAPPRKTRRLNKTTPFRLYVGGLSS